MDFKLDTFKIFERKLLNVICKSMGLAKTFTLPIWPNILVNLMID